MKLADLLDHVKTMPKDAEVRLMIELESGQIEAPLRDIGFSEKRNEVILIYEDETE